MKQGRSEDNQESKHVTTVKMNALNANLVHLDMEVAIPFWRGGGLLSSYQLKNSKSQVLPNLVFILSIFMKFLYIVTKIGEFISQDGY